MICAVYVKISTELEQQKMSLEHQESRFVKHIVDQGWTLFKVYKDIDTGTHGKRPGFIQMLEDAKDNKFDIILAKELSRLVRNIGLSEEFKRTVLSNKIHIWTLDGAINTLEDDISKYGLYAWIYEEESPQVVRMIFKKYIEGNGLQTIARYLSDEGYQTPATLKGKKNAGLFWHSSTVKKILKNRHYIGDLEQCKETNKDISIKGRKKSESIIVEDTHEAIITKEDYYCIQKMMEERATKHVERVTPMKRLFSDKLFCADCGKKRWLIKQQMKYECGTFKKHGAKHCSSHKIKEDALVDILRSDLISMQRACKKMKRFIMKLKSVCKLKRQSTNVSREPMKRREQITEKPNVN